MIRTAAPSLPPRPTRRPRRRPPLPRLLPAALLVAVLVPMLLAGACAREDETFASEGFVLDPKAIGDATGAAVVYNGTVGPDGSYYTVTVTTGAEYDVTLSGLGTDADLFLFEEFLEPSTTILCASADTGAASEKCPQSSGIPGVATAVSGKLFIHVKLAGEDGTRFELSIVPR